MCAWSNYSMSDMQRCYTIFALPIACTLVSLVLTPPQPRENRSVPMAMQDPDSHLIVLHLISWSRDSIALLEQVKFTLDKQNNINQPKIKSIKSPYF